MKILAAVAALVTGCLLDPSVPCGEGVCAPGQTCVATAPAPTCVRDEVLSSCAGQPDGFDCAALAGVEGGRCIQGACAAPSCGDGIRDPLEDCDAGAANDDVIPSACRTTCRFPRCGDGVVDPLRDVDGDGDLDVGLDTDDDGVLDAAERCDGDACRADCASELRCGDGVVDAVLGETCDDGNTRSRDGCGGSCASETARWREVGEQRIGNGLGQMPYRAGARGVFDEARGERLVFGGQTTQVGGYVRETLREAGTGWHLVATDVSPGPRSRTGLAYDAARAEIVLFGGRSAAGELQDTWTWNGASWRRRTPLEQPPARADHAMAYDRARDRVVLVGGRSGSSILGDTWLWDGEAWVQVDEPSGFLPAARTEAAMAYLDTDQRVYLFGGLGAVLASATREGFGPPSAALERATDTLYAWDGQGWSEPVAQGTYPSARQGTSFAATPDGGALILAGGHRDNLFQNSTHTLTVVAGAPTWSALNDLGVTRVEPVIAWSRVLGAVTVAFGSLPTGAPSSAAPARLVGASWTALPGSTDPAIRAGAALATEPRSGRALLFGGHDNVTVLGDGFLRSSSTWVPLPSGPPARTWHTLTTRTADVLLLGGAASSASNAAALPDAWTWDGATWTQRTFTGDAWPGVTRHAAALDRATGAVVVFGGRLGAAAAATSTTWRIDADLAVARDDDLDGPSARERASMASDPRGAGVILFGGGSGDAALETWRYADGAWQALVPDGAVRPGAGPLISNPDTGQLHVLSSAGVWTLELGDLDSNDIAWRPTPSLDALPSREDAAAAFDARERAGLVFGGRIPQGAFLADTHAWAYQSDAAPETCRAPLDLDADGAIGCADADCWGTCHPACPEQASCAIGPRCGDGVCDDDCGDIGGACAPREDASACPSDCP